jgi:hypothetical protein
LLLLRSAFWSAHLLCFPVFRNGMIYQIFLAL